MQKQHSLLSLPFNCKQMNKKILLDYTCPDQIWSGTVPVQTVPVQFGSDATPCVHTCSGTVPIHLSALQTERCKKGLYRNNLFLNEPHKILGLIGTDQYGTSDTLTDVDRWSCTVPVSYRSKNARMDRVTEDQF